MYKKHHIITYKLCDLTYLILILIILLNGLKASKQDAKLNIGAAYAVLIIIINIDWIDKDTFHVSILIMLFILIINILLNMDESGIKPDSNIVRKVHIKHHQLQKYYMVKCINVCTILLKYFTVILYLLEWIFRCYGGLKSPIYWLFKIVIKYTEKGA